MADYINGIDLSDFDFTVAESSGFLDAPIPERSIVRVLRSPGGRVRSERLNERLFSLDGFVSSASLATAVSNVTKLKALALRGVGALAPLEIELGIRAGWYVRAHLVSFQEESDRPTHSSRKRKLAMQFVVADPPSWINSTLTTVSSITTSAKEHTQGTAPPYSPVLSLYQPTDPVVTLKDHNGTVIGDPMTFDFTYSAGEYLVIDAMRREIYRNTSGLPGVGTECSDTFIDGDFIDFDYVDWDAVAELYGTVQLNSGGGTGSLSYYKCDF